MDERHADATDTAARAEAWLRLPPEERIRIAAERARFDEITRGTILPSEEEQWRRLRRRVGAPDDAA